MARLAIYHSADAMAMRIEPWQNTVVGGPGIVSAGQAQPGNQANAQYYWHRVGIEDALAGVPRRITPAATLNPRSDGSAQQAYADGYKLAQQDPAHAQMEIRSIQSDLAGDSTAFWRVAGIRDALSGTVARVDLQPAGIVVRKAPAYVPKPRAGPGVFVPAPPAPAPTAPAVVAPSPFKYLELVAELPVIGKIPFDLAVGVSKLSDGSNLASLLNGAVRFRLTGAGARDGFGLSGPGGPIAQRVVALISDGTILPDPRDFGLRAWVGTRAQGAVRLLNASTLRQLNLALI
jgi:hypothetical protein